MENVQSSMHLVLSTDAKPRLKWTPELHQRFIEAINQLGGSEKATPKSLMRVMGIPGLTLYHLKSHLQKYRLGKSQPQLEICSGNNKHEDCREMKNSEGPCSSREESIGTQNEMTESMQIAEALQMQMEVQKKLYEQIERHLQLKIEAQGKYLQSVLHKAQETLAGMINNGSPGSPPISELTETRGGISWSCGQRKQNRGTMCSLEIESSLTSSESSMDQRPNSTNTTNTASLELLPLFKESKEQEDESIIGRKRSSSCCVDQPSKMSRSELVSDIIDLNSEQIDLNCSSSFWEQ
ncbi:myb family transcription factor PHL8 isoform X2 [Arachis ipaensis]|uniref:myb family transcription factor PHL8 isoform X2 n=1 Tax=Arachis ipaensis TaxID=130454 RepID=UPI0007AF6BD2|nr:myb family transcription factor PHL8 isoform X2 [Arachis ipaensis]XP_025639086.1 myb family transcription factor PHL8 isoform X2 [Arachis hypogaea]